MIRYWNNDVMLRTESVLEDLMERLELDLRPSPDAVASTSPGGRGKPKRSITESIPPPQ